jgi:pyrimidine operon attenuation protein/uracil phosphoribosyltransferase
MKAKLILDGSGIRRALRRMASQITERHPSATDVALVGIRTNGIYLAERLAREMEAIEGVSVATGVIDVTLYRDDLSRGRPHPLVKRTEIGFSVDERKIILVDDVLFTGRTTRAALDALMDFGRPAMVELAVLVDRGHRELPIRADYVGVELTTAKEESVVVHMKEAGQPDEVLLVGPGWRERR